MRNFGIVFIALLFLSGAPVHSASLVTPTTRDGRHDFNFLLGHWHTRYRILTKRLVHDNDWYTDWYTCTGDAVVTPFWDQEANLEVGTLSCPERHKYIDSMTLRTYSRDTHQWSLWWGTKTLGVSPPQQVGHFDSNGIGQFLADDTWEGTPIIVRYQWNTVNGLPHFEQAFSADHGKSWETNWICDYTRA